MRGPHPGRHCARQKERALKGNYMLIPKYAKARMGAQNTTPRPGPHKLRMGVGSGSNSPCRIAWNIVSINLSNNTNIPFIYLNLYVAFRHLWLRSGYGRACGNPGKSWVRIQGSPVHTQVPFEPTLHCRSHPYDVVFIRWKGMANHHRFTLARDLFI